MTSRELEILNIVHQSGSRASIRAISKKAGLSFGYTHLVSKALLEGNLIKQNGNNVFVLTSSGKSILEKRHDSKQEKVPILVEVARSLDNQIEVSPFAPEVIFVNKELTPQSYLMEHNLDQGQIIEFADAGQIQKSIKCLTFVKRSKLSKL